MFLRVGELAGRVGYPMPTVQWIEGVLGEECIRFEEAQAGLSVLTIHDHVDEFYPAQVRDLLITQMLLHGRMGVFRQRRRLKTADTVLGAVIGFGIVMVGSRLMALWLAFLVAVAVSYIAVQVVHVLLAMAWRRWFIRRADKALVELLGREQVMSWLRGQAAAPSASAPLRARLRWLQLGAPMDPARRLRLLDEDDRTA